jgi:cold shock CspA family protein
MVVAFDDDSGLGIVRDDAGVERSFHCTAVADGSRSIEVGVTVSFDEVPGHLGRWEATNLRPG